MIGNGDYTFVSCFITNLGRTYFPDIYSINVNSVIRIVGFNWFKTVTLLAFVIETLVFWYLTKITHQRIKNYIVVVLILIFNFSLTIFIFIKSSQNSGLFPILISTFIGLFFLSFLFWALHVLFLSKKEKATPEWVGMIAGPVLVLTSLMVPLLTYPGAIYDSNHRYLTLSLVGVAITYASLLKLSVNNKKMSLFVLTFLLLLIFVNIKADRRYFSTLHINRNPIIAMSEWNQFTSYMGKYYQKYPDKLLLFYFDDSESGGIAASTFFYGFNLRVALENNIKDRNRVPAYTTVYAEAVSAVTDGKAFLRLGYPEEKIGIDQVYAFKVDKNGDLIDITQQTRKDLINEQKLLAK